MSDEEMEWARDVAKFFKGLYEDDVISKAQVSIDGMPPTTVVPMPNTAHPAYADRAINPEMNPNTIRIREFKPLNFDSFKLTPEPMELDHIDHILVRKKCWGPAPFVGDPLWQIGGYQWPVWMDELGRHISGDAELIIAERPVPLHRIL